MNAASLGKQLQVRSLVQMLRLPDTFVVFFEAQSLRKAMGAHEKALEWQELFYLASQVQLTEEDTVAAGYRVAGVLSFPKFPLS